MSKAVARKDGSNLEVMPQQAEVADAFLAMIERAARDPSVDLVKMQGLFDLKEKTDVRRARSAFLAAFSALQSDLPSVERKGTGHNAKKYARFEDFVEAIRPKLSLHGFSLSHRVTQPAPDRICITAVLGHREGHQEETTLSLPMDTSGNKTAVHALASSISYGKRYTGMAIIGVATEDEDDDGKAAGAGELVSGEQAEAIMKKISEVGANIDAFLKLGNVESVSDIPAKDYDRVMALLEAKKHKAASGK
jgi:hypothetical protein